MKWQTSWWRPLSLSLAVQWELVPCCSSSSAIWVQRPPCPAFAIRPHASPQSSSKPQDCPRDHSFASVLLRWPPAKELVSTVIAVKYVFAHRPGFFKLIHMRLQEFWASWQLHQFFTLLQKFLHSFLLVLHQSAVGVYQSTSQCLSNISSLTQNV